ncbi:hypothetical protein HDU91_006792 [Kappamyces sp. JEL0680]|nr:hypothetical protein HDU91_006792 [Kappamyces sp. JEL0680]
MLNKVIPTDLVAGIMIHHADTVTDFSAITFILRLFRQGNKKGFIKAFSDQPEVFCNEITKLERMMKILKVRSLHLWPRFQMTVRANLEEVGHVELIELRIPLTQKMKDIQASLMDCMNQMLLELKRMHPSIDTGELKLENSFVKSFDMLIRSQLEGIWQTASSKTKNLVGDLRFVRDLLRYLLQYDAVAFYSFLETERETVFASSKSAFKNNQFTWLHLDAANIVYAEGRKRVYSRNSQAPQTDPQIPKGYDICVEEQPKWRAFVEVLREIEQDRSTNHGSRGSVLVMAQGSRTCDQLRVIVNKTNLKSSGQKKSRFASAGTEKILMDQLYRYFRWKGGMANTLKTVQHAAAAQPVDQSVSSKSRCSDRSDGTDVAPASKRRRVRGDKQNVATDNEKELQTFGEEARQISAFFDQTAANECEVLEPNAANSFITVRAYTSASGDGGSENPDSTILDILQPQWIIMYDPDISFVRRIEVRVRPNGQVYKAENPQLKIKVYFLVYDNSAEEQQYLTSLRREKDAFEKLILQKSNVAIPIDELGHVAVDTEELFWKSIDTRAAGGQGVRNKKILVDVREFRSSLPLLIHSRRIDIVPCTIEVGDYVLSPSICVERKAPGDLASSLRSGRLYKQAQAMSLHYTKPVLLIEYPQPTSFQLSFSGIDNDMDTAKRLCLLLIHFPKLSIIWSSSPAATAEIFEDLQKDQPDPDLEKAQACGVESDAKLDSTINQTPSEMLLALPGINFKNYQKVMRSVKNLRELSQLSLSQCQTLIGEEFGRMLFNFFHDGVSVTTN